MKQISENWRRRFAELQEYRERFGDCKVPATWPENPSLGNWVARLRTARRRGKLSEEKSALLGSVGFCWKIRPAVKNRKHYDWEEMYRRMEAYKQQNGDCLLPSSYPADPDLVSWMISQRTAYREQKISKDRISRLEALGFVWNSHEHHWNAMMERLERHKDSWREDPDLVQWVAANRQALSSGRLQPDRQSRLVALGFPWAEAPKLQSNIVALQAYYSKFGNLFVPFGWDADLVLPLRLLEFARNPKQLREHEVAALNAMGMQWEVRELKWQLYYAALKRCKQLFGHLETPPVWSGARTVQFESWANQQRKALRKGALPQAKFTLLNALGFDWAGPTRRPANQETLAKRQAEWEGGYRVLQEFHKMHGHCFVPWGYLDAPQLGRWIENQIHWKSRLSPEQVRRLEKLGVPWNREEFRKRRKFE